MSNSADYSSGISPSAPDIEYSQAKQQLQEQLADKLINICISRGKAVDNTPSSPNIDYAKLSKFEQAAQTPVLDELSTTDTRPECCLEGYATSRARYFLKGVLEGRIFDQIPGYKEKLHFQFAEIPVEGPIHASDIVADPLGEWFSKGVLQGLIDKEDGILPGENEKLELLLQVDPELLVLWLENYIRLKKQHWAACSEHYRSKTGSTDQDEDPDGMEGLSGEGVSEHSDQDSEDYNFDVSMNELYVHGQIQWLSDYTNFFYPESSDTAFHIETAEARVRGEFKRMKTALEYLQNHQDQSNLIKSFNTHTAEFAELACRFLNRTLEMFAEQDEVPEHIFTAFFDGFATLYPSATECKGRDAEEIEFQKQFVTAVAQKLGILIAQLDDE